VAPSLVTATRTGTVSKPTATLRWTDNSTNETGWIVQTSTSVLGPWTTVATVTNPLVPLAGSTTGATVTKVGIGLSRATTYFFHVIATNVVGLTQKFSAPAVGFPTVVANSTPVLSGNSITTA
jgi:hypothetical protein